MDLLTARKITERWEKNRGIVRDRYGNMGKSRQLPQRSNGRSDGEQQLGMITTPSQQLLPCSNSLFRFFVSLNHTSAVADGHLWCAEFHATPSIKIFMKQGTVTQAGMCNVAAVWSLSLQHCDLFSQGAQPEKLLAYARFRQSEF